ncbi:MAP3K12-binding inhibitory protein 1 isoform 2-T2 [Salvelinus alpinus]|uniref:MAP3K12-binding inhibitory protein 1 isoform X2 n=1 Tax=Salvelinus alpinus TaxID=8036 RepID=UPI0039FBCA49
MADRMKLNDENGVGDKRRENVAITSSCKEVSSYRDSMFILLNLLTDFGSELKLGEAALKISTSLEAVDVASLQPTRHVFTCLQQHISKLQSVSNNLRVLVEAEDQSSSSKSHKDETTSTVSSDEMIIDSPPILPVPQPTRPDVEEEGKLQVDDLSIQIRANKSEIDRRISAFIERKQLEINENNVREFCNVIDCNQEDSCARTDAVFTPYPGFKSHVKELPTQATKDINVSGLQSVGAGCEDQCCQSGLAEEDGGVWAGRVRHRVSTLTPNLLTYDLHTYPPLWGTD